METPNPEELLRKIEELELAHANLRNEMSKLGLPDAQTAVTTAQTLQSLPPPLPLQVPARRSQVVNGARGTEAGLEPSESLLRMSPFHGHSALPFQRGFQGGGFRLESPVAQLDDRLYLNILQSMGQAIHIMNSEDRLIYWTKILLVGKKIIVVVLVIANRNQPAEKLYGYTAAEVLGKTVFEVMVDDEHVPLGSLIINRVKVGESWTGLFPVRSKTGRRFSILVTDSPLYDEDGTLIGVSCIASDSKPFETMRYTLPDTWKSETNVNFSRTRNNVTSKLGLDPQQPLQVAISSKITDLATRVSNKVQSKMKIGKQVLENEVGSNCSCRQTDYESCDGTRFHNEDDLRPESHHRENAASSFFGEVESKLSKDCVDENEGTTAIRKVTSRAEAWINKKAIKWPWKGNELEFSEPRPPQFGWAWVQNDLDHRQSSSPTKSELKTYECHSPVAVEAPWSWSSPLNVSTTSSKTSCGSSSTSGNSAKKLDIETDSLDFEVLWEDLIFKEQIGQAKDDQPRLSFSSYDQYSCAKWSTNNKSVLQEVAIKVFSKVEYTEDAIFSFRQEVSLMKGLRHPNILLFMGAVTSPEHLCIISEFLSRESYCFHELIGCRGSLFRQLQRKLCKLDWRRRVHMALDIARGMNYLHCCNPPIVHRDLKSSNLLVDKNWTVKVADFGLSRIKHEIYLTTKTGKGTPQWMAPEVLRHEPSDEKSDIYSFGVILWELATEKTPWESLNAMWPLASSNKKAILNRVIGAVGFMNQILEIPSDVDVRWTAIIESCWQRATCHG
ncbi:hypothetical protein V2J09_006368 [Rumex salicifolius]